MRRLYTVARRAREARRDSSQTLAVEGGQSPRGAVDVPRCLLYVPGFEEESPARVPFFFQNHRVVGADVVVKPLAVFCYCAPFTVQLTEVVLVLPHSFAKILCFPNVGSGAVGARHPVNNALCFFRWCAIFGPRDEAADGGGRLVGDVDACLFQYAGYCLAGAGDIRDGDAVSLRRRRCHASSVFPLKEGFANKRLCVAVGAEVTDYPLPFLLPPLWRRADSFGPPNKASYHGKLVTGGVV